MANQFLKLNVVKATFDPSGDATKRVLAAHSSGVFIPAGAIIMKSMYDVLTTFTSGTSAATIAVSVASANDIVTATAISVGTTWNNVAALVAGTPISAATAIKLSADKEVIFTVGGEVITAGKLDFYIEYYL